MAVVDGQIVVENQLRLTNGAEDFAEEVHAIKEAITDVHRRGLSELNIYLHSRSALQALQSSVSQYQTIAEIKALISSTRVEAHMHWLRAHVGQTYNKRADILAKAATTRRSVDMEVKITRRQDRKHLLGRALSTWQVRWSNSETERMTYEVFPRVTLSRQQGDFYVNQVFSGEGTFGDH